jgi:hypothetical protein
MKRNVLIAVLLAAGLGWAADVDKTLLAKKNGELSAEYGLAKESQFYFVFNVPGRKLELRVRGMSLRSWPLSSIRFWGRPDFAGTVELAKKTALKAPERIVIKPGGEAESEPTTADASKVATEFDLEALELKDMPTRFSLDFDNGLHVTVRVRSGFSSGFGAKLKDALRWYVGLPLRSLFGPGEGQTSSHLELVLDEEKEAQAIYWHFFDGIKGLVL